MTTYCHLRITYRRDDGDTYDVADTWAMPECLKGRDDVHVSGTDEDEDEFGLGIPVREVTVEGWLDDDALAELRSEWSIEPDDAEPALGFLGAIEPDGVPRMYADERHTFHPMDFNVGGWTPVLDASLSLIGDGAVPA
jgi:hypothetical protein